MEKSVRKSNRRVIWWIIIASLLIIYVALKVFAQNKNTLPILAENYTVDTLIIHSSVLNEEREILIYKPLEFKQDDSASVIYLLDGEHAVYHINRLAKEQLDKAVIGIGVVHTNRRRDMIPGNQPDKFLEFISGELVSEIETKFLIDQRILFGHSNAGGFVVYSMINAPSLFDKYIASSPTPIADMIDAEIYTQLDSKINTEMKFYFSYGSEDKNRVKKWSERLYDNLQKKKFDNFDWKNEIYEGENHNSSASISLIKGLRY